MRSIVRINFFVSSVFLNFLASLFGDRPDSIRSDGGGVGGAVGVARRSTGGVGGAGGGANVPLGAQERRVGSLLNLSFPSLA